MQKTWSGILLYMKPEQATKTPGKSREQGVGLQGRSERVNSPEKESIAILRELERLNVPPELVEKLKGHIEALTDEVQLLEGEKAALEELATKDQLTGLVNRRGFDEAFHSMLDAQLVDDGKEEQREGAEMYPGASGVVAIDLDNFKYINDTTGSHAAGDECLRLISKELKASLRTADVIARVGGDEFVVLLPKVRADGVRIVAEKIQRALGRVALVMKDRFGIPLEKGVSGSIGFLEFEKGTIKGTKISADYSPYIADYISYVAKKSGKKTQLSFQEALEDDPQADRLYEMTRGTPFGEIVERVRKGDESVQVIFEILSDPSKVSLLDDYKSKREGIDDAPIENKGGAKILQFRKKESVG